MSISARRLLSSLRHVGLATCLATAAVGCASSAQAPDPRSYTEAAEYQFARAEHLFSKRDYDRARAVYQVVAREYPFSQFAARSDLRVADTYYGEKAYGAAIEAYRAFARLRPRHESIDYADFRVVESYVKMMPKERLLSPPTFERDLTDALLAYREARRYVIRYREGDYVERAREVVTDVSNRLADHEIYVARYYERREQYEGAMRRYQYLATSFPESDRVPKALLYLAQDAEKADMPQMARDAYAQILNSHPDAPEVASIARIVQTVEAREAAAPAAAAPTPDE